MKWLRTGRQLGQAVKNVQRLRTIVATLAKYGFVDVVERMNLGKFLPSRLTASLASQADRATPERLRLAFEELGPTFVKLGQVLSTRPDLMPEAYLEEFTRLQDNVQPLPASVVRSAIERELGRRLEDAYAEFDDQPLASASIGQVHTAVLRSGEKVVVKVQRPDIERVIQTDISLLAFLAGLLERYVPESRVISPKTVVDEFFRTLSYELDFVVEANNMTRMAENLAEFDQIIIPRVYKEFSTHKILTMERLEGLRVNDIRALDAAGIDRKAIVDVGARAFMKSVMIDGLFHGDMHGGNLFILPGNKLGVIDFGIVGRLSHRSRNQLANMTMALLSMDFENLCYLYAELGSADASIDFDAFQRAIQNTLSPYMGVPLGQLNMGKILIEATKVATRFQIQVPGDWMIVFKAILTIEGMGRTLDPDFDLLALGQDLVKDLLRQQYSVNRLSRDAIWIARDVGELMRVLPRQLRWMFRKFNSNDFAFEIKSKELVAIREQLDMNGRRASLSLLTVGLAIAGSLALQQATDSRWGDFPIASVVLFGAAGLSLLALLRRG